MQIHEAISLLFERADASQTFWNFYATVATALLAFLAAGKTPWMNKLVCAVLTVGFLAFAVANFISLEQSRKQREALIVYVQALEEYQPVHKNIIEASRPPTERGLLSFHMILDVTIIFLIWVIPYIRQRHTIQPPSQTLDEHQ